jgi:hypothetical protein
MSKFSIFAEFISFLRMNKKTWMIPIIVLLLVFGFIIVIGQGSALAPFIYTLF